MRDADRANPFGVALGGFEPIHEVLGDFRAAHLGDALDLRGVGDRPDPRDDLGVDARLPRALDEREVVGVVEEQLGDEEIDACVDLLLQVSQIGAGVRGFRMLFRVARAGEAKVVARADELDELGRVAEPALRLRERRFAARWIAAQREHVLDAEVAEPIEGFDDVGLGDADAREVRHRLDARIAFDAVDQIHRQSSRAAAGAPGDRDVRRRVRRELFHRAKELLDARFVLRREELERVSGGFASELVDDLHRSRDGRVVPRGRRCQEASGRESSRGRW